uniref:Putative beta-hydroxylase n=1 Tax=Sphaerisporangium sp. SANK 60911 TaxID=1354075 RepID=V5YRJ6_9ACTN|nr:putative beta-hydroxylase [Sphaerisporangium sp. SANK 60911]
MMNHVREVSWTRPGLVGKVPLGLDVARLREETASLLERHPMIFENTQQLALQIRPGTEDPWYESCYQEKDIAPEDAYDTLNPELRGTYFETVLDAFPFQVRRARLMALSGRTCYSVHRDETARYHVAIDTTEHALFIFVDKNEVVRIPPDGDGYLVDTREVHTAMNGARNRRLHLVVAAAE